MSQQTIRGGGVFTAKNITDINDNFDTLFGTNVGGTLPQDNLIIGDVSNQAAAVPIATFLDDQQIVTTPDAGGRIIAGGRATLDGSGSLSVSISGGTLDAIAVVATLIRSSAPGATDTAYVSVDFSNASNSFTIYQWTKTGTAAAGTEDVTWVAYGTPD